MSDIKIHLIEGAHASQEQLKIRNDFLILANQVFDKEHHFTFDPEKYANQNGANSVCFVAERDEKVIGGLCMFVSPIGDSELLPTEKNNQNHTIDGIWAKSLQDKLYGQMSLIAVDPACRRSGVAGALKRAAFDYQRANRYDFVIAYLVDGNKVSAPKASIEFQMPALVAKDPKNFKVGDKQYPLLPILYFPTEDTSLIEPLKKNGEWLSARAHLARCANASLKGKN